MRNQDAKGEAMKNEDLRSTDGVEGTTTMTADVDTGDSEASDALEVIEREAVPETERYHL